MGDAPLGHLASSFLADLADLQHSDSENAAEEASAPPPTVSAKGLYDVKAEGELKEEGGSEFGGSEDLGELFDDPIEDGEVRQKLDDIQYKLEIIQNHKSNEKTEEPSSVCDESAVVSSELVLCSEGELKELERICLQLDTRVIEVFNKLRNIYQKRFPEMASIITNPLQYVGVVSRLGNATQDIAEYDLSDILPNSSLIALILGLSVTTGKPLSDAETSECQRLCEKAQRVSDARNLILAYLEEQMSFLAPNLTALMGSFLAVRLLLHAGGLEALAKMPAQNIMLLGADTSGRFSSGYAIRASGGGKGYGVLFTSELVQTSVPSCRIRAIRLLSGKCALAARCDLQSGKRDDSVGRQLRAYVVNALMKSQEPPPAPMKKSLPIPEDKPRKKRGGKRYRKWKEKYGQSELAKKRNRLTFGLEPVGDYADESGED